MDIKDIKELIRFVDKSSITELEIEGNDSKVRIAKKASKVQYVQQNQVPASQAPQYNQTLPNEENVATPAKKAVDSSDSFDSSKYIEIKSPMVGTFYASPSPDSEAYVKQGDTITQGQTLCIIEAMKLMNEIQSESSGKVAKVLVNNIEPVEYNQVLFWIEK
jgi:acetyl-CoA carboxylase biotin carboxyl carrier protein